MTPQPLDYNAWKFWLDIAQLIGLIVIGLYTWWANREKVNSKRFKTLETKVGDRVTKVALDAIEKEREERCERHRERTGSIEGEMKGFKADLKHLPTKDDIGRVHARMDTVASEIDQAVGELRATTRQVNLVLESLLQRDKR